MRRQFLISALVIAQLVGELRAHDTDGYVHESERLAVATGIEVIRSIAGITDDQRAVLVRSSRWRAGQTLTACFLDGDEAQRRVTVAVANDLLRNVNLRIDWGDGPRFRNCPAGGSPVLDVRVTFTACCWAYIGRQSLSSVARTGPSIAIGRVHGNDSAEERRIAYHELLHVLGFHHEHQNPNVDCEAQLDVPGLMRLWRMDEAQARANIRRLSTARLGALDSTSHDRLSVMHYYFDPRFVRNPNQATCLIPSPNMEPSPTDRASLIRAYAASGVRDVEASEIAALARNSNLPEELRDMLRVEQEQLSR